MGEMSKFFGCWVGFFLILRVTYKGSGGEGTVQTWWVQQFCDVLVRREILTYDSGRFCTKGLSFN